MKNINIISLNILGKAELLVSDHQKALTAFRKKAIQTEGIELGLTGFAGDMVKDTKHHGGNDKAICCYNSDHFAKWKKELGFDLEQGAFGENLTLEGENANESHIYIGDRYQLGEALVEVSEPRGPCYMIGIRYNYKKFPVHLQTTGLTGYYLRTIKPGFVRMTDKLIHISSHPEKISVMDVNHVRYHDPENKEWLQRLINLPELTEEWRVMFEKKLIKL
ncbi:MOSC domain-containing protein YiiM [Daejeonella rubra]|uniref:MOSC domain-containing protein YiiM n=1 Tax=Daejeonella rubra TaxID=990371 RepID=A0A1G9U4D2_9SPHI|nr:MOSC domain-containing protein [Daejeonella rubra]SDM54738.1 MOSC domain-containing protein YiiM [Daejeonella rubra]